MAVLLSRPASRRAVLRGAFTVGAGALVGALVLPELASAYSWTRTLTQGATGNDVKELQIRVAGYAAASASHTFIATDGEFGPATAGAVRRFQAAYGLTVDAEVGPQTQAKLNALESADGSTLHF